MIEVNGMAHVILTVSQWEKARAFYAELLPFLGMTKVYDGNNFLYHVGGRTAIGIQRCAPEHAERTICPEPCGSAPSLPAGAVARGCRRGGGQGACDRRPYRSRPHGGRLRARLLLLCLRGSRWHSARGEFHSGQGFAGFTGSIRCSRAPIRIGIKIPDGVSLASPACHVPVELIACRVPMPAVAEQLRI